MTRVNRAWPDSLEELELQAGLAELKYGPLVAKLTAGDLLGLVRVAGRELQVLKAEARGNAIAAGHRPPGTSIGR